MKKIIYTIIGIAVLVSSAVYIQHLHNEYKWNKWRTYGMEIKERAITKEKSLGWSKAETENYIREELEKKGIEKPGYCIYCSIQSMFNNR